MINMARFCCCGAGCPSTLELTLAGVDAAACAGCQNDGAVSWQVNSLSANGVHSLPKTFEDGTQCIWGNDISGAYSNWDFYQFDTTCTTATTTGNDAFISLTAIYSKISGKFTTVYAATTRFDRFGYNGILFYWTGSSDLGDTLNNAIACGTSQSLFGSTQLSLSNGGTGTLAAA